MGGKAVNLVLPNGLLFGLGDRHLTLAEVADYAGGGQVSQELELAIMKLQERTANRPLADPA